ncbi:MAG: hypothetical protein R2742_05635 [Micropruina glycogenica]
MATMPESSLGLLDGRGFAGFMAEFANLVQFAEVGQGTIDFGAVIPQALESGAEYLLVEADQLYGRDLHFDCLADFDGTRQRASATDSASSRTAADLSSARQPAALWAPTMESGWA